MKKSKTGNDYYTLINLRLVLISLGLLLLSLYTEAQIKRKEPVVIPVAENQFVTWGDIDQMKIMFGVWTIGMVGWIAQQIYQAFIKKQDKTTDNIEEIMHALSRIEEQLKHTPTRTEVITSIREEIEYAQRIQKTN